MYSTSNAAYAMGTSQPETLRRSQIRLLILQAQIPNRLLNKRSLYLNPFCDMKVFERRAFSYSQSKTAKALSGKFSCTTWDSFIVCASHTELPVWHAVVALSTPHDGFSIGGALRPGNRKNQRHRLLGLQQYSKAELRTYRLLERKTAQALWPSLLVCCSFAMSSSNITITW